jgi:heterodisulfide reductase subunit C
MKKQTQKTPNVSEKASYYKRVGKNIYKTGSGSYRVRIMGFSKYTKTKKEALAFRDWVLSGDEGE